jgi:beta-glucosidase
MPKKLPAILIAFFFIALYQTSFAQQPSSSQETSSYRDPNLPLDQRVGDLISDMTLEEKISQLTHDAAAIPRLGVPAYNWWNEGLHGVARAGVASVFPQAIGMAATFDEPLMHEIGDVISTEFRAKYYATVGKDGSTDWYKGLTVWSPNINIFRDPRWGRGQETYGEDPYLTSRMGVAFVKGLQGDDAKYLKTIATPKHYAVHSGPESTRHEVNVDASRHDMEDTYVPAFRATVTEGKAASVMCAYNSINGQPACANDDLLVKHLRDDWKFDGYVVSDCGAETDIAGGHKYTTTSPEGFAMAIKTGTDLDCVAPSHPAADDRAAILQAVLGGFLTEADIDHALHRLFRARFQLGMFDPAASVPFSKIHPTENDMPAHRKLALKAAQESIVLLKNKNNFLPLKKHYATIAVIGPDADSLDALVGNYNGTPSHPVTVLAGIRRRFPQSKIINVEGTGLIGPATSPIPSTVLFADKSHTRHGLKGQYFSNTDLQGPQGLTRVDPTVNFAWGFTGVTPQLVHNYSVRWTGELVPVESSDYVVGFTGQDGYRLWLDDQLIAEDWTRHRPATTGSKLIHLEKGHAYAIKIEYFQTIRGAEGRLTWSIPGREEDRAIAAARQADLVVVAMGLSARVEGEEMNVHAEGFSGGDRTTLDLPKPQQDLLERIAATGKPTTLLLMNGSALSVNWADEKLPAILEAWYPGEEGGTAIAQVLAGDYSPSGRLPVTFYKSAGQLPPFEDYSMAKRTYRYFDGEPLYPFGYGLSYTSFAYSNARIDINNDNDKDEANDKDEVQANGTVTISVDVSNTGSMAGDEVVQLYLTHAAVSGAPIRALQGIQRVHLQRGAKTIVSFTLKDRALSIVDEVGVRRIVPGALDVWIGGGQPATPSGLPTTSGVSTKFSIVGEAALPD